MKKGILIIVLMLIALVGWLIHGVIIARNLAEMADRKDSVKTIKEIPPDYSKLFRKNNELIFDKTLISKTRNSISQFDYENEFRVSLTKIDVSSNLPINKLVIESFKDNHVTYDVNYHVLEHFNNHQIVYKSGVKDSGGLIYLNIFGNDTQTIEKNDSVAYYYSMVKNFYIKYQLNKPQDFYMSVDDDEGQNRIPAEIMFIKRLGNVYFILLTANSLYTRLDHDVLSNLVQK